MSTAAGAGRALRRVVPLLLLATAVCCGDAAEREDRPSNLLLITVDTLRADHLGAYGYDRAVSPVIDRLATESVVFERAYATIPKTNPSLASLMTGLYPQSHGILELAVPLPEAHQTLAERLRAKGYETAGVVGQFNLVSQLGFGQGFDVYLDDFPAAPPGGDVRGKFTPWAEKRAAAVADHAMAWLAEPREAPFFLWVHFMDPHAAYDPPAPKGAPQEAADDDYPATELARAQIYPQAYVPGENRLGYYLRSYDAEIRYLDGQIGRLLEGLERGGLADETWIVLTADHGEYMGDPDVPPLPESQGKTRFAVPHFHHGATLSDGEIRVPLMVRAPASWVDRIEPGRVDEVVSLVDVVPTLAEFLELSVGDVDGSSFAGLLAGEPAPAPRAAILYTHETNGVGLRTRNWKLVAIPRDPLAPWFSGSGSTPQGGALFLYEDSGLREGVDVVHSEGAARDAMLRQLFGTLGSLRARRASRGVEPGLREADADLRARLTLRSGSAPD
jgi:arylsulfatase